MRRTIALILGIPLLACGDGTTEPPPPPAVVSAAGTWTLSQIDGQPLPYTLPADPGDPASSITAGTISLQADASFTGSQTVRIENASLTVDVSGTWYQSEGLVDLLWDGGCADRAVVTATALRIARDCALGVSIVFSR